MIKAYKYFITGTVVFIMTVPFLFSQDNYKLELKAMWYSAYNLHYKPLIEFTDTIKADTNISSEKKNEVKLKKFRMRKSPTVAVLLSAVLPGAGQFYNESYWKIPVIGGLVGYFGYEYFRNNNLYKDYRDRYSASQNDSLPEGNLSLKSLREFYRDQRDDFVWYFLIVYVVNLVDAYVDAHLFDFDVSDNKFTKMRVKDSEYRLKFNLKF